jgi:hypothetical protein
MSLTIIFITHDDLWDRVLITLGPVVVELFLLLLLPLCHQLLEGILIETSLLHLTKKFLA